MPIDALVGPGFFCVGCTISADTITALIAWCKPGIAGQVVNLQAPKQPDSPTYTVQIPPDTAALHTEVILRVCSPLESPN